MAQSVNSFMLANHHLAVSGVNLTSYIINTSDYYLNYYNYFINSVNFTPSLVVSYEGWLNKKLHNCLGLDLLLCRICLSYYGVFTSPTL